MMIVIPGRARPLYPHVMPGLARLRGRSRFGAAKGRASTFFAPSGKTWMAGS
ncbi:hypothetical protein [Bradyrhizobium sp. SUTN9-2]|uniref:hypothetical protein n=1 Tax=Bradyrhizobium sp. SUTN9-2 TaxID=1167456 RepID=UPI0013049BEE|nr:hypothetical protein [Bradyrhizobium sp. SUTN9-2]